MSNEDNKTTHSNEASDNVKPYFTLIVIVTTIMSALGLHAYLPGNDWVHYTQVAMLSIGTFACLKSIWTYQIRVFIPLAVCNLSWTALFSHLGGVCIVVAISSFTTYVGITFGMTSEHDMHAAQARTSEMTTEAKSNHLAASSVKGLIDSQAEKMDGLAKDARLGKLSGTVGEGSVYQTYAQTRDSLKRLSAQIDDNQNEFETDVARLSIVQGKMRSILESELSLADKVVAFEATYRKQADLYTALTERDLSRQIEASLNSFLAQAMSPERSDGNVRVALRMAQNQAQDTVRNINSYVQAEITPLSPMPAYRLASPAIVSFRYVDEFWMQFALALALDLSLLIVVWMQIASLRKVAEGTNPENFTKA